MNRNGCRYWQVWGPSTDTRLLFWVLVVEHSMEHMHMNREWQHCSPGTGLAPGFSSLCTARDGNSLNRHFCLGQIFFLGSALGSLLHFLGMFLPVEILDLNLRWVSWFVVVLEYTTPEFTNTIHQNFPPALKAVNYCCWHKMQCLYGPLKVLNGSTRSSFFFCMTHLERCSYCVWAAEGDGCSGFWLGINCSRFLSVSLPLAPARRPEW